MRKSKSLDGLVVEIEAKADSLMKGLLRFVGRVYVYDFVALYRSLLVVNSGINNTIRNGLVVCKRVRKYNERHAQVTFATIYSASSSLSRCNFRQMSLREILE